MRDTPAHDVAQRLLALMPDLSVGVNIRVGDLIVPIDKARSSTMVTVVNRVGRDPLPYSDGGRREHEEFCLVTVAVRADQNKAADGEAMAIRIFQNLVYRPWGQFKEVRSMGSDIRRLGPDEQGFPLFTVEFELVRIVQFSPVYFGQSVLPGSVDASFITSLSSLSASRRTTAFSVNASSSQYTWCAMPARFGVPEFSDSSSGTVITFTTVATVPLQVDDRTEDFTVFRSTSLGLGARVVKAN